jgi:hypothetical protein
MGATAGDEVMRSPMPPRSSFGIDADAAEHEDIACSRKQLKAFEPDPVDFSHRSPQVS